MSNIISFHAALANMKELLLEKLNEKQFQHAVKALEYCSKLELQQLKQQAATEKKKAG